MITAEKEKLTYADYAQLEEGAQYQLIDGELVMSPAPTPAHQDLLLELASRMRAHTRKSDLGRILIAPIDVYLDEHNTFRPDIVFISKERLDIIGPNKIEGAPDLTIEILSPATAHLDVKVKKEAYTCYGVKEYWIVDPMRRTVAIFGNRDSTFHTVRSEEEETPAESRVVAGFEVDVTQLFAGLD